MNISGNVEARNNDVAMEYPKAKTRVLTAHTSLAVCPSCRLALENMQSRLQNLPLIIKCLELP